MGFGGQRLSDSLMGFSPPPPPRSEGVAGRLRLRLRRASGASVRHRRQRALPAAAAQLLYLAIKPRRLPEGTVHPGRTRSSWVPLHGMGDESPVQF